MQKVMLSSYAAHAIAYEEIVYLQISESSRNHRYNSLWNCIPCLEFVIVSITIVTITYTHVWTQICISKVQVKEFTQASPVLLTERGYFKLWFKKLTMCLYNVLYILLCFLPFWFSLIESFLVLTKKPHMNSSR
jgi:hypothetical protein